MSLFDPPTEKELEWANLERSDKFHGPVIERIAKSLTKGVLASDTIIEFFMQAQLQTLKDNEADKSDREQLLHLLANYGAAVLRLTQMHSHGKN